MPRPRSAVRLTDVAARAGVSLATASRSLSGSDGVSDGVAARVREIAHDLGYVANVHARTLAGGSTSTVGLIVHEIGDPYFSEIASGVLRVADQRGFTVQICHSGRDPASELKQIRTLIAHRADAIVVAGSGYTDPALQADAARELTAFERAGGRVAVIGRHHVRADAVLPANEAAGEAIAEHVLGLGHRSIAVVSGSRMLTTVVDRLAGIATALQRYGLSLDAIPVLDTEFTRDGAATATAELLRRHPETTAVLALNDAMAIGVLSVLRARGVAVPQRVSVAGVYDIAVAADLAPSLTTVRLPMAEMGEYALGMALERPARRPRRRTTRYRLIARDSTAPPP